MKVNNFICLVSAAISKSIFVARCGGYETISIRTRRQSARKVNYIEAGSARAAMHQSVRELKAVKRGGVIGAHHRGVAS